MRASSFFLCHYRAEMTITPEFSNLYIYVQVLLFLNPVQVCYKSLSLHLCLVACSTGLFHEFCGFPRHLRDKTAFFLIRLLLSWRIFPLFRSSSSSTTNERKKLHLEAEFISFNYDGVVVMHFS